MIEEGKFAFGMTLLRDTEGNISYETRNINHDVPEEVVIMQVKTFLRTMEKTYFQKFSKNKN